MALLIMNSCTQHTFIDEIEEEGEEEKKKMKMMMMMMMMMSSRCHCCVLLLHHKQGCCKTASNLKCVTDCGNVSSEQ